MPARMTLPNFGSLLVNAICMIAPVLLLAACGTFSKSIVTGPTTVRPPPAQAAAPENGAIFQTSNYRPIFEDRRARYVGDTMVVVIAENTTASNAISSQAERSGTLSASAPTIQGLPGKSFQGATLDASSSNKFGGKGASSANNGFTGTIAVTVMEVLSNGNLVVAGEKQIALVEGTEKIRFSGVVNPTTVGAGNSVQSTQVADARIEYAGDGYLHEAQVMGWLARFFLSFLPF
jgi:flagellar L-ring protein precursor FlgH